MKILIDLKDLEEVLDTNYSTTFLSQVYSPEVHKQFKTNIVSLLLQKLNPTTAIVKTQ